MKNYYLHILIFFCIVSVQAMNISVINVSDESGINKTIELAQPYDTLIFKAGIYHEAGIKINKPLTLIGEKNAIIDGRDLDQILTIQSDHVTVTGLEFHNTPVSHIKDNAAIKLDSSFYCEIRNNTFKNNFFAIYLARSADCKIINNQITSDAQRETTSGNGIHLWYCKNITVEGNHINSHRDGIYFEFVEDSEINNNLSENNLRYGLHFMFSNRCNYSKNTFRYNGAGVAVMYTKNVNMTENRFEYNWGAAAYGLLLKEITDSNIKNNIFLKNSSGLYAESSNRIQISGNTFEQNGWAIRIMGNCLDNNFSKNNFLANTFDVATNTKHNFNVFNDNYWDSYNGYDLDRDGIGDLPYRPVKLFSYLVEQNEPTLLLIRSFFVDMINIAESIIPVLTPQTLLDESPSMRLIK
jgi:nitrous oxidase accessory protein